MPFYRITGQYYGVEFDDEAGCWCRQYIGNIDTILPAVDAETAARLALHQDATRNDVQKPEWDEFDHPLKAECLPEDEQMRRHGAPMLPGLEEA